MTRIPSLSLCAVALPIILPLSAASAQTLIFESRDSSLTIAPFNLGYNPGAGGGDPGALIGTSTTMDSTADLAFSGSLFYGPDSFDRVNSGTYDATQDVTFSSSTLAVLLDQTATQSGTASPIVDIDNHALIYFSVDADTDASFAIELDGETNLTAKDFVRARLRKVTATGGHLSELFNAFSDANTGGDALIVPISLDAGARYELLLDGRVRVISSSNTMTSRMHATLTIPEPASISLAIAGALATLTRRRRA